MPKTHFIYDGKEIPIYSLGDDNPGFSLSFSRDTNLFLYCKRCYSKYSMRQINLFVRAYKKLFKDFKHFKGSTFADKSVLRVISGNYKGVKKNYLEIAEDILEPVISLGNGEPSLSDRKTLRKNVIYVDHMRSLYGNDVDKWDM